MDRRRVADVALDQVRRAGPASASSTFCGGRAPGCRGSRSSPAHARVSSRSMVVEPIRPQPPVTRIRAPAMLHGMLPYRLLRTRSHAGRFSWARGRPAPADDLTVLLRRPSAPGTSAATALRRRPAPRAGTRPPCSRGRRKPAAGAPGSDSGCRSGCPGPAGPPASRRGRACGSRRCGRRGAVGHRPSGAAMPVPSKQAVVARGSRAAGLGPALEVAQLHPQDRALDALHAVVEALEDVVVLLLGAPVAQHPDRAGVLGVVGRRPSPPSP